MPTIHTDISNTELTVTREAVLSVVHDLIIAMGLTYNVKIKYPGSDNAEELPLSVADEGRNLLSDPNIGVSIVVEEEYLDDATSEAQHNPKETFPIFEDTALGIRISPVYTRTELVVSLNFNFPNKAMANQQLNNIRRYSAMFRKGLVHEVKYYYLLPQVNVLLLKKLFDLREAQAGYGDTLTDYLNTRFDSLVTTFANRSGTKRAIGKNEIQADVVGKLDFEIAPDKPEKSEDDYYTLSFSYRLRYDKIISTVMEYPLTVHNQLIPSTFYERAMPYELGLRIQQPALTRLRFDKFTRNQDVTPFTMGAPVPIFNSWQPKTVPAYVDGILRLLTVVDPASPRDLFNLGVLGELAFTPEMITYLTAEHANLNKYGACPFFIALYENDKMLGDYAVTVDASLNVTTTFDMDLRKNYRCLFGIVTRLDVLDSTALDRLRNNPTDCINVLMGIDQSLEGRGLLPATINGAYIPKSELAKAIEAINARKRPINNTFAHGNMRVGSFVLTTKE